MAEEAPTSSHVVENKPHATPKKSVLILSSTEGLPLAEAVRSGIERVSGRTIEGKVWNRTNPSGWLLEHVVSMVRRYPFVVVVLTADDEVVHRSRSMRAPRDNLIMEMGLAIATNGPKRTFLLRADDVEVKLPTDVDGLLCQTYHHRSDGDRDEMVHDGCVQIARHIADLDAEMSWDLFFSEIQHLSDDVQRSQHLDDKPGLRPHVVVGVNMGGFVAGGLLFYLNRSRWHFLTVWTKNESPYRSLPERQADFMAELRQVVERVRRDTEEVPRILLVDDSDKSAEAMSRAFALVKQTVPDATVMRAALVYLGPPDKRPEFVYQTAFDRFKYARV